MSEANQKCYRDEQAKGYVLVLNSHFAVYRNRYKKGSGFRVFSDLLARHHGHPAKTLA